MELEKLRIMVTGGAGFIGSHLVDKLIKRNNRVIVYDNFNEYYFGKENNIRYHFGKSNFTLIRADILDVATLCKAMKDLDIVFHLAAQPGVGFSMKNPLKTHTVNTTGTLNVLNVARKMRTKKIVFGSSSSVYGIPQYTPLDEKHPTHPVSVYGISKLTAEKYCKIFNDLLDVPVVSLRYHTVYGPRQRPDMAIYKWTKLVCEDKSPVIYGDGKQSRDFTYISDIVEATLSAAELDEVEGEVFNVGSGTKITINRVVNLLLKLTGKERLEPVYEVSRVGDVPVTHADISKAKMLLGYAPKVTLKNGIERFLKWYSNVYSECT